MHPQLGAAVRYTDIFGGRTTLVLWRTSVRTYLEANGVEKRANKKQRRSLHSWSFGQLQEFILYKAKRAGVPVQFVDARNASPHLWRSSGCVDSSRNRRSQEPELYRGFWTHG